MNDYLILSKHTITAISSPLGVGAISIIRITGKKTKKIIYKIFKSKRKLKESGKTNLGIIIENGNIIDEVVVIFFKKPYTYTGEDLVEIYCHGSIYIQNKIINLIIKMGARLAINGEFTYRAYLNKKITLLQAESVLDIIKSTDKISHTIAINNLINNELFNKIKKIEKKLLNILSNIELSFDFVEEDIVINYKNIYKGIKYVKKKIKKIIKSYKITNLINKGCNIAIVGPVNSGKSTLMNALIKENKSIISNIPGTTRDVVEGKIKIKNFNFNLFDTAGLRKTKYIIEKKGIKKTIKQIKKTNIILFVFDYRKIKKIKKKLKKKYFKNKKIFLIANKIDKKEKKKKKKIFKYF
ncbi:MAG: tRNA uridine-5-carboxymethylaminomethyl(34) synthesis GTPase MnmE [Candidatus Shikimatogenerans bostrichidophilus]|nr:MAG: tRNA uridine-5-carboxymethylaminomethyl(34) synthesis GTPase MnmE [Candidatus Shikimatogenerans bostrichidophilus]